MQWNNFRITKLIIRASFTYWTYVQTLKALLLKLKIYNPNNVQIGQIKKIRMLYFWHFLLDYVKLKNFELINYSKKIQIP